MLLFNKNNCKKNKSIYRCTKGDNVDNLYNFKKEISNKINNNIVVQKYGGTSLATTENILHVANQIIKKKEEVEHIVVVVSAMGKTTDNLIQLAEKVSSSPCTREMDVLLSTGEQQSIALLSMALKNLNCNTISLTGMQVGITTKGEHTKSSILNIDDNILINHLLDEKVVIIAGFQGVNEDGEITTLGRGGSDTTAVALAAKLNCSCEIYTDVDGIFTVDPRIYAKAKKLDEISYDTALEMSSLGSKVIDKRAVALAKKFNIPIYIANSNKKTLGTFIRRKENMEEWQVTSLVLNDNLLSVSIENIPNKIELLSKVFKILNKYNLEISMVENSVNVNKTKGEISFICSKDNYLKINNIRDELLCTIGTRTAVTVADVTRVSIVGNGRINQARLAEQVFNALQGAEFNYKKLTTSELSLSYIFNSEANIELINKLAQEFSL